MKRRNFLKALALSIFAPKVVIEAIEACDAPVWGESPLVLNHDLNAENLERCLREFQRMCREHQDRIAATILNNAFTTTYTDE